MPSPNEVDLENVPAFIRKQAEQAMAIATAPPSEEAPEAVGGLPTEEEPAEAAAESEPSPPDPKAVVTEEMTKEQRYKVLEGMQRAEARRAREMREKYEAEIAALRARVEAPAQPAPAVATPATVPQETIERLQEAFGQQNLQDLDEFLRARGYVKADDLKTVKDEMGRVSETVQSTAKADFYREMDRLTDGQWRDINKQQWFIDHMNEEEGNTGMTRLDFAKQHMSRMDAPRLARYFTDIKPPGQTKAPKPDKKSLASPPSTPASAARTDETQEIPIVKTSELEKFSRDVITGRYAGREAEMNAMQQRIWAAQRAGRIVQDR